MRLAGKYELNRTLRIVDNGIKPVKIAEKQGGTLIGSETAGKSNGQHIVTQSLLDGNHLAWSVLGSDGRVGKTLADSLDESMFEHFAHIPDFFVRNSIYAGEALLVIVMGLELRTEHLFVH